MILSSEKLVEGTNSTRQVQAVSCAGFHSRTAMFQDEFGLVTLRIVGRFETVKSKAEITIRQARALFADLDFQCSDIGVDMKQWLKVAIHKAKGL